eukprot:CAMPEP_0202373720 /NCGR_PEP_ID=MMETSP1127-20130417/4685_1 /ASSEMBLY_ACC=CAM_ASM_000462 /TAXON_ID=3047 /ORGANISM="Dunaliella tertiolecta, Strain CCMP1320" /LENGTH=1152 /DNA_ID=CAMNT_0048970689 /DNA_START=1026 /DNA_END=4484 /DNA_ORIENTATION=-
MKQFTVHISICLLAGVSALASQQRGPRTASLLNEDVQTFPKSTAADGRSLMESDSPAPQVFLIGYDPAVKADVHSKLVSLGASILTPVPPDHWLVKMKPADVAALQDAFPSTTAAAPPKGAKVSKELKAIIEQLEKQPEGVKTEGLLAGIVTAKAPDGQQQLELSVHGLPFTSIKSTIGPNAAEEGKVAKAAAAAWTKELREGLGDVLSVGAEDPCAPKTEPAGMFGTLPLTLCLRHLPAATSWLTEQGNVVYVEAAHNIIFENLQSASAMQTGALAEPLPQSPPNNAEHFPLWSAGLDGTGQVVGVADTGLDLDSCFFWDGDFQDYQDRQVAATRTESGNEYRYFDGNGGAEHRKVQSYYVTVGNSIDDTGHGTHCAGTVAGASSKVGDPEGQPNLATGVAPGARLSIFDLQSSALANSESGEAAVRPPADIASIFDVMHQRDVRIVSNSWGSSDVNYNSICQMIDRYAWVYDMLIVYAAGNAGFQQAPDIGTVPAPALCKNVLAVGATDNWRARDIEEGQALVDSSGNQRDISTETFSSESGLLFHATLQSGRSQLISNDDRTPLTLVTGVDLGLWAPGTPLEENLETGRQYNLVVANPTDACSELQNSGVENSMIIFEERGDCSLDQKAQNVANAGAAAGIMQATDGRSLVTGNSPGIPFMTMPPSSQLNTLLNQGVRITTAVKSRDPHNHIMWLSSYGPPGWNENKQARLKPEIAAPGVTLSAHADGVFSGQEDQCNVGVSQGTSMAAPAVAGAAAIVRQYFVEGFYPTGKKVEANGFKPPASLVRAVLLAGAESMTGIAERTGQKLGDTPNNSEGYGRLNLARSLPVQGVRPEANFSMHVYTTPNFEDESDVFSFQVDVTEGPLIVVLAWMDLPGVPGTRDVLIQDLDLKVTEPGGGQEFLGNGAANGDHYNTNERVVIDAPVPGNYTIEVSAQSLLLDNGPQPFTLVALGGIVAGPAGPAFPPAKAPVDLPDFQDPTAGTQPSGSDPESMRPERTISLTFPFEELADAQEINNNERTSTNFLMAVLEAILRLLPPNYEAEFQGDPQLETMVSRRRSLLQQAVIEAKVLVRSARGTTEDEAEQAVSEAVRQINEADSTDVRFPDLSFYGVSTGSISASDVTGGNAGSKSACMHLAVLLLATLLPIFL